MASHALKEKQPGVLVENRVGRSTCVTGDVFLDVLPQHGLNVSLLKLSLQDQLIATVDGTHGTQLCRQESQQVLGLTMKP